MNPVVHLKIGLDVPWRNSTCGEIYFRQVLINNWSFCWYFLWAILLNLILVTLLLTSQMFSAGIFTFIESVNFKNVKNLDKCVSMYKPFWWLSFSVSNCCFDWTAFFHQCNFMPIHCKIILTLCRSKFYHSHKFARSKIDIHPLQMSRNLMKFGKYSS